MVVRWCVRVRYAVSDMTPNRPLLLGVCVLCVGCVGGDSVEETPGPFPNPVAKLDYADGTAYGSVWESRLLPAC